MPINYDLVIEDGLIVQPSGTFVGNIGIKDGCNVTLSQGSLKQSYQTISAKDKVILPGVVDLHLHFSEPGRTYWEGWDTGSHAAAVGGVTTVIDMPLNAIPATTNIKALQEKAALGQAKSHVDFALWGGFVNDNLADLEDLAKSGIIGFKAFMVDTKDDSFKFVEDDLLYEGMCKIASLGHFLAVHAEDNKLVWEKTQQLQTEGRLDRQAWSEARSPEAELEAIGKALRLAEQARCPLHIVHVSIPEGAALINEAKAKGQKVTFETCSHYLALTDQDFYRLGPVAKCAPPLRNKQRQDDLWTMVLSNTIDCITSDHSPCTEEEKSIGETNIWSAWGGINGIQTLLPLMLHEGIGKRNLSFEQLSILLSQRPAQLAGLWPQKGEICIGADADFVIVDMNQTWQVTSSSLKSKHPQSPFMGEVLNGGISSVILKGKEIVHESQLISRQHGEWLDR